MISSVALNNVLENQFCGKLNREDFFSSTSYKRAQNILENRFLLKIT